MKHVETTLESLLFQTRWLLAPFYVGLAIAIAVLLIQFVRELAHLVPLAVAGTESKIVLSILTLVDISLIANLLIIIIFSGYENFVSKIGISQHEDRPNWMGKIGFSDLKIKVMGSIVAISAIELLRGLVSLAELTNEQLAWKLGIHLTFVVSGVLFAVTDRVAERKADR